MNALERVSQLRVLLSAYVDVPEEAGAPLELDSLSMVRLIEDLEDAFGVAIRAVDATPVNFHSLESICAMLDAKRS